MFDALNPEKGYLPYPAQQFLSIQQSRPSGFVIERRWPKELSSRALIEFNDGFLDCSQNLKIPENSLHTFKPLSVFLDQPMFSSNRKQSQNQVNCAIVNKTEGTWVNTSQESATDNDVIKLNSTTQACVSWVMVYLQWYQEHLEMETFLARVTWTSYISYQTQSSEIDLSLWCRYCCVSPAPPNRR